MADKACSAGPWERADSIQSQQQRLAGEETDNSVGGHIWGFSPKPEITCLFYPIQTNTDVQVAMEGYFLMTVSQTMQLVHNGI